MSVAVASQEKEEAARCSCAASPLPPPHIPRPPTSPTSRKGVATGSSEDRASPSASGAAELPACGLQDSASGSVNSRGRVEEVEGGGNEIGGVGTEEYRLEARERMPGIVSSQASACVDVCAVPGSQPQGFKEMLRAKVAEYSVHLTKVEQQMADLQAMKEKESAASKEKGVISKGQGENSAGKKPLTAELEKRQQTFIRQFGVIFKKICTHKWAWPFMAPVDTVNLGLHDYFDVIKKPMDLGTVKKRLDGKDGTGYQRVKDICSDVRLVFSNAMLYNEAGTDVYLMALKLSGIFEDWWLQNLASKVEKFEEEVERQESEAIAAKAAETSETLSKSIMSQIEELEKECVGLKQQALSRLRPMDLAEKHQLGQSLQLLPPHKYDRALEIILEHAPPAISTRDDEIDIDITALDSAALWRLHHFIRVSSTPGILPRTQQSNKPDCTAAAAAECTL